MLTQERVRELFDYNPETGVVVWKKKSSTRATAARIGKRAGSTSAHSGYRSLCVDGKYYPEHRVIFVYMTGKMPGQQVDHINGVKDDNRWCNLRQATHSENQRNKKRSKKNTSGRTGVYYRKNRNTWVALIWVDRKLIGLGSYKTKREAIIARVKGEKKYGYHSNHDRYR